MRIVYAALFVLALTATSLADAPIRELLARDGEAVVPLRIVLSMKVTMQGREMPSQERENEALGTVIDKKGLIVTSYFAVDPVGATSNLRTEEKIESEIKTAKLVMKDGTEVPLKVVLRDADLDLIFLRAEKSVDLQAAVTLNKKGPALELGDAVTVLSRLGTVGNRVVSVAPDCIQAVIDKPRRLYVTDTVSSITALGCPVYTSKGELAGIITMKVSADDAASGVLGGLRSQILPAILPVADIFDDAEQAKAEEAQKPTTQPAEAKK